jgi:hypothetical protein
MQTIKIQDFAILIGEGIPREDKETNVIGQNSAEAGC